MDLQQLALVYFVQKQIMAMKIIFHKCFQHMNIKKETYCKILQ